MCIKWKKKTPCLYDIDTEWCDIERLVIVGGSLEDLAFSFRMDTIIVWIRHMSRESYEKR